MQESVKININDLPKIGYYSSNNNKREKIYKNEPHIHKQGPLSGVKAEAHKLYSSVLNYFPKGFAGSKNSNFYEFLSLGKIPYIIGSVMLISIYSLANKKYNAQDGLGAGNIAKKMGAGVILYGIGKWLSKKISHKLIKSSTGVDLDLKYINKVNELPEPGQEKGETKIQYPGVFDSADFPRKDLIALDSELNHGNIYAYEDKIAKKAGFKNRLNAPNQTIWPKIRELKVRTTALENISKYIMAATGVALGSQSAFEKLKKPDGSVKDWFKNIGNRVVNIYKNITNNFGVIKNEIKNASEDTPIKDILKNIKEKRSHIGNKGGLFSIVKEAFKQLWNGSERNIITKHYGKALIILSGASVLLTWLIPAIKFKKNPNTMKSKVDSKKDYEVC